MSDEQPEFTWYIVVQGGELEQGDFLRDFPILIQPDTIPTSKEALNQLSTEFTIEVDNVLLYDVVVMTQSCDFNKLHDEDLVTLCPTSSYRDLYDKGRWKPLREGRVIGAHLLNRCDLDGHEFEYQIVDLTRIFSVPYSFVKKVALERGERVRLLPPYREHLAQAFARRFMRVGLPIDLPSDYPYQ